MTVLRFLLLVVLLSVVRYVVGPLDALVVFPVVALANARLDPRVMGVAPARARPAAAASS